MPDKQISINSNNRDALLKFQVMVARAARVCEPRVKQNYIVAFLLLVSIFFKMLNSFSVVLRFFCYASFIEYCKFGTFRGGLFLRNFQKKKKKNSSK